MLSFKSKWFLASLVIFAIFNIGFNYVVIGSGNNSVRHNKRLADQLAEDNSYLSSVDIAGIVDKLTKDVDLLKIRKTAVLSQAVKEDEIPLLISLLEKAAERVGVVIRNQSLNYMSTDFDTSQRVTLHLKLRGSFEQILTFLNSVRMNHEGLSVGKFLLRANEKSSNRISAELSLFTYIAGDSTTTKDDTD